MTYLVLVSGIWEMAQSLGGPEQQAAAVAVLDLLGNLHFCRMRLTTHTTLVQVLLPKPCEPCDGMQRSGQPPAGAQHVRANCSI